MASSQARSFPGRDHLYDVLIVGAGLCGCEAAYACAQAGLDTLLVTTSLDTIYNLAGDGAVLAPRPGTLLASLHAEHADESGFVNSWQLHRAAKYALEHSPGIHLLQSSVSSLVIRDGAVTGVSTWEGVPRVAKSTALCVGSFLQARLRVGDLSEVAGRLSEMAYDDLYNDLVALEFNFTSLHLEAEGAGGALPYTVDCQVFAPKEVNRETLELKRFGALYGAGVCAFGYQTYEEASAQGRKLADVLIAASSEGLCLC